VRRSGRARLDRGFNGDVLTEVDLAAVIASIVSARPGDHRAHPVENPARMARGDRRSRQRPRFLEKPDPHQITCDTINAGIYVLEPDTFDRIPTDIAWSIERSYFPSLIERKETFVAYVYKGYWIDIGTPEKYMQVHRDIMDRRYHTPPFSGDDRAATARGCVAPTARVEEGAILANPGLVGCSALYATAAPRNTTSVATSATRPRRSNSRRAPRVAMISRTTRASARTPSSAIRFWAAAATSAAARLWKTARSSETSRS
jgi:hypothetical protein